jgi:hypothetical protein
MTSPDPPVVNQPDPLSRELSHRHYQADCQFNAALSRFQALGATVPELSLAAIVKAAQPAFEDGFCYLVRQDPDTIEVVLRHAHGAEEVSIADATTLCSPALLLAGLLGIAVEPVGQAPEADEHDDQSTQVQSELYADDASPVSPAAPAEPIKPEAAAEPDLMGPDSPADLPGDHPTLRALTPEEIEAGVGMVKQMAPAQRKAFTIAYRVAFDVPATETRIATTITQVRHLQFIDRFTVEAAGGIAA